MKGLFTVLFFLTATFSYGQFGLYASAVYINFNGNSSFYNNTTPGPGQDIGSMSFQGADFGLVQQNSGSLKIIGAEIKTFKGVADNVCSGTLHYTIYPQGLRPAFPVFQTIDLGFYSDCFAPTCGSFFGAFDINAGGGCCSEADQKWQNPGFGVAANIDLTVNPIGTYYLEIYYSFTGEDGGNGCGNTKFDNNSNNPVNYTAGFIITPTMPVSFGNIHVLNNQLTNKIYWNTFSESDTKNFSVERSANSIDFYSIGKISAAGFSAIPQQYSFVDELPLNGINYYRIKMTETGGRYQNSAIVSTVNKTKSISHVLMNPVKGNLHLLNIKKGDLIILSNSYGAEIRRLLSDGNELDMQTGDISTGIYFLRIISGNKAEVVPIVISHP